MKYIHLFIAFFLLLGCETDPLSSDEAVAVRLIPSLGDSAPAGTRVVDQTWYTTDRVGVSIDNGVTYKRYKPTTNGTSVTLEPVTADQTLYYPANGDGVTFTAFCPYPDDLTGNTITYNFVSQEESLDEPSKMQKVDLVYHKGTTEYSKNAPAQTLEFKHRFSKVVIIAKRGTGLTEDISDLKMTLTGMPTEVSFDISTGVLGTPSGSGTINPEHYSKAADKTIARAIIAPHTKKADRTITFVLEDDLIDYSYTIPNTDDYTFEEGKVYVFKFTLNQDAVVLENATIKNWEGIDDDLVIWDNEKNWLTVTPTEVSYYKEGRKNNTIVIRTNHPAKPGIRYSERASDPDNAEEDITWLSAPTNGTLVRRTPDPGPNEYEWTFTYDVAEYTDGIIRRIGYIQFSIGSMTVPTKVVQSTISEFDPTITYVDGNTNCFIVKPGTTIIFPLTRPFDPAIQRIPGEEPKATSNFDVVELWDDTEDVSGDDTKNGAVSSVSITDADKGPDAHVTVVAGNNSGNALIAIRDKTNSDEIVWSYHIWVTDYNPYAAIYTNTNSIGTKFIFMDRNLGAIDAGFGNLSDSNKDNYGLGLFYQWGRKDPFPATGDPDVDEQPGGGKFTASAALVDNTTGTIPYAIKNPNIFLRAGANTYYDWYYGDGTSLPDNYNSRNNDLWGHTSNKKTVYDPCPAGWCVPKNSNTNDDTSPWYDFNKFGVFSYGYTWGTNAVYPNVSIRRYADGNIDNMAWTGRVGHYWSASPSVTTGGTTNRNYASALTIGHAGGANVHDGKMRAFGGSVRCVRE